MLWLALLLIDVTAWVGGQGGAVVRDGEGRIREVSLGYRWVTDTDMEILAQLTHLKKLDLSLGQIGERGLARLHELKTVTDLTLYYSEFVADVAMANLRGWTQLERLNLRGTDITDTSLDYIGGFTNLKWLDISSTQITNNGLDHLGSLTQLEDLSLGGNKISGQALPFLRLLPKLRSLNLNGSQKRNSGTWAASVTDFDLDLIGGLASLERLDLGGTKVTDLGLGRLSRLQKLRMLAKGREELGNARRR